MAELAKTHITVTDESAYAAGIDTLIPLYVFATEQDKVIDETTGEIAIGTTKGLANQVSIVTSKKDVIDKYGIPSFVESNGTVQQGNELNEYGLYALYDAMGATSLAYALRADIDLKQMKASEEEPTSNVKNGTYWLDMYNTSLGIFRCISATASPAKAWEKVEPIELYTAAPKADEGSIGDVAVYFSEGEQYVKEKTDSGWEDLGSDKTIYVQPSIKYPKNPTLGDIWVRTTNVNNGANYVLKQYSSSSNRWNDVELPVCVNFMDAEALYGSSLSTSSLTYKCTSGSSNGAVYKYTGNSSKIEITGTASTISAGTMSIKAYYNGAIREISVTTTAESTMGSLIEDINDKLFAAGLKTIVASEVTQETETYLKIIAENVSSLIIDGDAYTMVGITNNEYVDNTSWIKFKDYKVTMTEPREVAAEGTLWFNDDTKVDILINNGTVWKNYQDEKSTASIYVTSAEPTGTLVNDDLWIDPSRPDYPVINRYVDGTWETIDNGDQSTPSGVVFADARYYAENGAEPTYSVDDATGKVTSNLLKNTSSTTAAQVDPDCPNPQTYPEGILLFNTRFSTNNVKEYKAKPFEGLYDPSTKKFSVGGYEGTLDTTKTARWVCASGNAADGSGLFGKKAQRAMVTKALASAIVSNEDIRTFDYDFFFATCPGYPELDDELINLNVDKKEMFEIITDTPKTLAPNGSLIQAWATNKNNAVSHGTEGRVLKNEYVTRQYPPMGLASNVDGAEIAVPTSVAKMKNLLVLPRGQICAGTQNGQVTNLASVGYITAEDEYASVVVNDGLGEVCTAQSLNPIMPRRNTGLLFWGEATECPITSSLSDEHAIITLLRLKRQLEAACLPFFFRINNESLRNEFHNALKSILNIYVGTGEIYDYALEVESQNNAETIGRKELWAAVAIEIAKGVEQIYIPIRVVATGALSS